MIRGLAPFVIHTFREAFGVEWPRVHLYAPLYRPPSFATVPKGWTLIERPRGGHGFERRSDLPLSEREFGIIGYEQPLSDEQVEQYQLEPLSLRPPTAQGNETIYVTWGDEGEYSMPVAIAAPSEFDDLENAAACVGGRIIGAADIHPHDFNSLWTVLHAQGLEMPAPARIAKGGDFYAVSWRVPGGAPAAVIVRLGDSEQHWVFAALERHDLWIGALDKMARSVAEARSFLCGD